MDLKTNKIKTNYKFRLAKISDIKKIMLFIKNNWDKNHILSKNIRFFKYQFCNKNKINFVIAINKKKQIEAIQGFIVYSDNLKKNICGSIACVEKNSTTPFLGLVTMKKMLELIKHDTYLGIGTNPKTFIPLVRKFFNRHTGKMNHYYLLNSKKKKFHIAKVKSIPKNKIFYKPQYEIKLVNNIVSLEKKINLKKNLINFPYKDKAYIEKRYFKHPIFKYKIYLIIDKFYNSNSFFVSREIKHKSSKILNIVDFIGKEKDLSRIGLAFEKLIKKKNYEYIDLLCANINKKYLADSNFKYKNMYDQNIIPLYFQPFIRKNVDIWYETSKKILNFLKEMQIRIIQEFKKIL